MVAREKLIRKIKKIGIRKLINRGCSRKILQNICSREVVRISTLFEYKRILNGCDLPDKTLTASEVSE